MTEETWTTRSILEWIEGYLARHGDGSPRLSAQWLVGEALGLSRMQLFMDLDRPLSLDERAALRDWTRRRAAGEPLQYITGKAAFRHIELAVKPGVLIPRPETEVLVSEALALLPAPGKPQDAFDERIARQLLELTSREETGSPAAASDQQDTATTAEQDGRYALLVADICTGTGCIACSIAHEHPATRIVATDVSREAASLARANVEALGLEDAVRVIECDLGDGIDDELMGSFDLVVSNPPYVPTSVLATLPEEVAGFEPALALDGGPDGLLVFRRLLAWCGEALAPGGGFAFELHETCLDEASAHATAAGFEQVRIVYDLAGRPRVLVGRKPVTQGHLSENPRS